MAIFYQDQVVEGTNTLSEDESRHCAQVLRHQVGDPILVFDGVGGKYDAVLTKVSKNRCEFEVVSSVTVDKKPFAIHLAIAPTKNADRMEWMVEKLSEVGVDQLTFIETQHSERRKLRLDRMEKKAVSAMKQSGNALKIQINEMISIEQLIESDTSDIKLIAHVDPTHEYLFNKVSPGKSVCILIGPEGDFSQNELAQAKASNYLPVSLGKNILRTETAGFMACCLVNAVNEW